MCQSGRAGLRRWPLGSATQGSGRTRECDRAGRVLPLTRGDEERDMVNTMDELILRVDIQTKVVDKCYIHSGAVTGIFLFYND